jgi:[ribosomal protein S18]-alanine N-acetyltransferase
VTFDETRRATGDVSRLPAVIIPASLRDIRDVHALEKACFGPDAWGYFELFFTLITPWNANLKAVVDGKLAGLVVGEPRPTEGIGWIATIGVHPHFQRRGIGQALLAAAEAALPQNVIKLTVRRSNAGAIALYQKFGYQRVNVWQGYYAGGEDGLVMEKSKT